MKLYAFAGASAVFTMFWVCVKPEEKKDEGNEEEEGFLPRLIEILMNTCSMMFAWGILFATRWYGFRTPILEEHGIAIHTCGGRVFLALFISGCCFGLIFTLDKVDDMQQARSGEGDGKLILTIINAIGILVGLSWEHAFDGGVEAVASKTGSEENKMLCELGLAAFVALLIVPAWRRYILKKAMQLDDYEEEAKRGAKASQGSGYTQVQGQ